MILNGLTLLLAAASLSAPGSTRYTQPIEPIELPPSIQQGVDMMYIDPEIAPAVRKRDAVLDGVDFEDGAAALGELLLPVNPLFTELRRGLVRYRMKWGALLDVQVPAGSVLKPGGQGERVALLRERLGLRAGRKFDEELAKMVRAYQQAHGFKPDGVAGAETIASLNLGAGHYERLLLINLDRARTLPSSAEKGRYILVDAGAARLYLFEDGRAQDSMKVIVGKAETATPMMAALMRYASVNPYWNVPPELVQTLIAPRVISGGVAYLQDRRYEILADWSDDAAIVDPTTVDWAAAAAGKADIRVRQRPGPGNSMGDVKFMMPNDFGIYLHDTPDKSPFGKTDRWISNGCIRVEDAHRLATWLFGTRPKGSNPDVEEQVDLPTPVPVYVTYLTAGATRDGVEFRKDPYGRDSALLSRYVAQKHGAGT